MIRLANYHKDQTTGEHKTNHCNFLRLNYELCKKNTDSSSVYFIALAEWQFYEL